MQLTIEHTLTQGMLTNPELLDTMNMHRCMWTFIQMTNIAYHMFTCFAKFINNTQYALYN